MYFASSRDFDDCTMVQNRKNASHLMIHFPTSLGVSEQVSKKMSAAECAGKVSSAEQACK